MERRCDSLGLFGRLLVCFTVATILPAIGTASETAELTKPTPSISDDLTGWLLVATPRMRDPRFAKTVIFLVDHTDRGAMGLIVNRPIAVEQASKLLERMIGKGGSIDGGREVNIHYGGPVRPSQGIFLHSNDYAGNGTVVITGQVSLTSSHDILRALAKGEGPTRGFLAMGYAGWGPGQLENEIRRKDWVTVFPDDRLVFDDDMQSKWQRAIAKQGVDL